MKKYFFMVVACLFWTTQAFSWEPKWTMKVQKRGEKAAKKEKIGQKKVSLDSIKGASCYMSESSFGSASASRNLVCNIKGRKESKTFGFSKGIKDEKVFDLYLNPSNKLPDYIITLTCCH